MNKLLAICLFSPLISLGQISFVKFHKTNSWVDQVAAPYELSNGNFICSALLPNNNIWHNYIYLFSECGEMISSLLVSAPDDYMLINNFLQIDSNSVLATGYRSDSLSVFTTVYLVFDIHTLELLEQKQFFETSLHIIDKSFIEDDIIYQLGSRVSRIVSTSLNKDLFRNLHLYKNYTEDEYPDLWTSYPVGYLTHRIFWLQNFQDSTFYSTLICLDRKLREVYKIQFEGGPVATTIEPPIWNIGGDTVLLLIKQRDHIENTTRNFIRQYVKDAMIYEREVFGENQISDFAICDPIGDVLRCFENDGAVGEFNKYGELTYYSEHLQEQLEGVGFNNAITTRDGGTFSIGHSIVYFDGVLESSLGLVKITKDYAYSPIPHPTCIVATKDPQVSFDIIVYPNPSQGSIRIVSDLPVVQYRVFSATSELLASGRDREKEFDLHLNFQPGLYVIHLETTRGWFSQKILIVD